MPRRAPAKDPSTEILAILAEHPEGLSREDLQVGVGRAKEEAFRFRRVLKAMEAKGQIRGEGNTRARRYFLALPGVSNVSLRIWEWDFSPEASEVIGQVNRSMALRKPCSYERDFLDAYRPNQTFYLREKDRASLHALGGTPDAQAPAGTYARQILERLLIDLSWNSSRLEGNTYSLLDTERLFKEGTAAEGRNARETQMILNHKQTIEYLVEGAGELSLTPGMVRTLHGMLSENLLSNPADEGRLRQFGVGIHESTYIPLAVPSLIEEIFEQLLLTASAIQDPFEQAFFLLVHIPYLQPFADVNKRTSRLAANLPLMKHNLQPLSFKDLPQEAYTMAILGVYELRRIEALRDVFLWAYQRSAEHYRAIRQSLGEPDPFRLQYRNAIRELVRELVRSRGSSSANAVSRRAPSARSLEVPPGGAMLERIALHMAKHIPASGQSRFQAVILQELKNLNEGTFARYGLRPSEFERWRATQTRLLKGD